MQKFTLGTPIGVATDSKNPVISTIYTDNYILSLYFITGAKPEIKPVTVNCIVYYI